MFLLWQVFNMKRLCHFPLFSPNIFGIAPLNSHFFFTCPAPQIPPAPPHLIINERSQRYLEGSFGIFGFADLANFWFGFSIFALIENLRFSRLVRFARFLQCSLWFSVLERFPYNPIHLLCMQSH